jgi:hypothetical protein
VSHVPAVAPATGIAAALVPGTLNLLRARGADHLLLIAPEAVEPRDGRVLGCAVRDGAGEPGDAARALTDALGEEVLARTVVAYVGCVAGGQDPWALAREAAAVARVCPHVALVEPEGVAARLRAPLTAAAPDGREHRRVPPRPGAPVVRRFVLGTPVDARALSPVLVAISDHQGKSGPIAEALHAAGHVLVEDARHADVVLIDHDVDFHGKRPLVEACVAHGGQGFLYPHGADPALMAGWDGIYEVFGALAGALVISDGHAAVGARYGYPLPMHVIGWPYCPQAPRRARPVERVLFAPTHPPYLGNPRYPLRNAEMFERLLACPVELTVRHIGPLEVNGLRPVEGVRFVRGDVLGAPGMLEQIDAADCVVADRSTFGNLAVSRGVTTVLWDSVLVYDNGGTRHPDHLHLYADLLHHPFDADGGDMWDLIRAAAADTARIGVWRERFIGHPLDVTAVTTAILGG